MKNIISMLVLCLFSVQGFSQEAGATQLTKEMICRGAAVSVVANVNPFLKSKTQNEVVMLLNGIFKEAIKDAPAKAYDLLKQDKTKEEVITILNADFLKLDDAIVAKGLINSDPDDY